MSLRRPLEARASRMKGLRAFLQQALALEERVVRSVPWERAGMLQEQAVSLYEVAREQYLVLMPSEMNVRDWIAQEKELACGADPDA